MKGVSIIFVDYFHVLVGTMGVLIDQQLKIYSQEKDLDYFYFVIVQHVLEIMFYQWGIYYIEFNFVTDFCIIASSDFYI